MIEIVITTAGRQAIVNATQTGTRAVTISQIGVGTGKYTASESQTALQAEVKRLPIISGGSAGDNAIHVAYRDESGDAYNIHEFGLFLEDGTLFGVYSSATAILQKTAGGIVQLAIDIALDDISVENITFGDITYTNAAATTENAGVMALATDEEVQAGEETQKAVTPKNLTARTATETRTGLIEIATTAEATAGTDDARAMTPAKVKAQIDSRIATSTETIAGTNSTKAVTPATLKTLTATTARAGLVELATEAEVLAGTDTGRAVTPAAMAAKSASESQAGFIKLASEAEVLAGTETGKAVTPAGLSARTASASRTGLVELATNAETLTGTDAARAVTPAGLSAKFRDIVFSANSNIENTSGNGNISFFPSGQSVNANARAGTCQLSLARFDSGSFGPSLVLFKSRGTSVKASGAVQGGETLGQISFMGDPGGLDYSGTAIGARAAYISGDVFDSATVASGNVGIRGALRLMVCSDGASQYGKGIEVIDNTMRPTADNEIGLGTSGRRYTTVYAATATINTSDEREKVNITDPDEALMRAWGKVDFKVFRFRDAYAEKGDDARWHVGVIAQQVIEAFAAEGLDAYRYGLLCLDKWDDQYRNRTVIDKPAVMDENGEEIEAAVTHTERELVQKAGERYGIRYEEALALECAYQRWRLDKLEAMIGGR